MNYGTYTEYKIKNGVFENVRCLKFSAFCLEKYTKIMDYGTCRECQIKI